MIIERLKTQRPPKTYMPTIGNSPTTYPNGIIHLPHAEFTRRSSILTKLARECPYKVGDVVRPRMDEVYEKEGTFKVMFIIGDWLAYKGKEKDETKVEWPISDVPLIVQAKNINTGTNVVATTNYFTKEGI